MAIVSLGAITFDNTGPKQATSNLTVPAGIAVPAHRFWFQHLPSNSGDAFVGLSTLNTLDYAGVFGLIPAPISSTDRVAPQWVSPEYPGGALFDMQTIYVDGNPGDIVIGAYMET